jgi:hypothetical protein
VARSSGGEGWADAPILGGSSAPQPKRREKPLRKEVIQPQVPLRLPCYDLVPIAEFTLGACLPPEGGLAPGDFRCPPLWWLDGRCVQGSGTHSPRRS